MATMARRHRARIDTPLMRAIDRAGFRRGWFAESVLRIHRVKLSKVEAGVENAPTGMYERAARYLGCGLVDVLPDGRGDQQKAA